MLLACVPHSRLCLLSLQSTLSLLCRNFTCDFLRHSGLLQYPTSCHLPLHSNTWLCTPTTPVMFSSLVLVAPFCGALQLVKAAGLACSGEAAESQQCHT